MARQIRLYHVGICLLLAVSFLPQMPMVEGGLLSWSFRDRPKPAQQQTSNNDATTTTMTIDAPTATIGTSATTNDQQQQQQQQQNPPMEVLYLMYPSHMRDIPEVPYLVEALGKELYRAVNKPKYKFYLYMTAGSKLPDETSFVIMLNMVCNLLYGLITLLGFCCLPRNFMLLITAVTILVGPALVLVLLGTAALVSAAFTLYPLASVATMWCLFFSTSRIAQVLGRRLGLDRDDDGDVDWLDVLCVLGQTKIGQWLRVDVLHKMLNDSMLDPFQAIHRRLDAIQQQQQQQQQEISSRRHYLRSSSSAMDSDADWEETSVTSSQAT